MFTIQIEDSIQAKVIPKKAIKEFRACLAYENQVWIDGPFHKEAVSKTSFLCSSPKGTFLVGLVPRVVKYCKENKIAYELKDYVIETHLGKPVAPYLPGITPREDQTILLDSILEFYRGLIVAPPGIGKTVLAGLVLSMWPKSQAIIVVHLSSLFDQTLKEFQKWFGVDNVGVIGKSQWKPSRINVVMAKTASVILAKNEKGEHTHERYNDFFDIVIESDILIIDEAHHAGQLKGMYAQICQRSLAVVKIGFTATPNESKAKKKEALVCEGLLGPIIGRLGVAEGIEKGLLAKPKLKLIPVPINTKIGAFTKYRDLYLHGILKNRYRNRLIVRESQKQVEQGKTVLIMLVDVLHGQSIDLQTMAEELYGLRIEIVQGSTKDDTRVMIQNGLEEKKYKCVITTTVWNEGINIPSLDCVINGCGGKSEIATLQRLGRGLRTTKEKDSFLLIDFLDPYKYLAQHTIMRLQTYVKNGLL